MRSSIRTPLAALAVPGLLLILAAGCKSTVSPVALEACAPGEALAANHECAKGQDLVLGSAQLVQTADSGTSSASSVPEADFASTADQIDGLTPDGGLSIGGTGAPPPGVLLDARNGFLIQDQHPVAAQLRFLSLTGDRVTEVGTGSGANGPPLDLPPRTTILRLRMAGTVTSDAPPGAPATCQIELNRVSDSAVLGQASVQAYALPGGAWVQQGFVIEAIDAADGGTAAYGWMLRNASDAGVLCIKAADAGPWTLNVEAY